MSDERAFYMKRGLNVDMYDPMHEQMAEILEGDIEFYLDYARKAGGPVLELGSGTGRVTWSIANGGCEIVGLDLSPAMLEKAESKRISYPEKAGNLISFVIGDMRDFSLSRKFSLIIIPFRAWQVMLSPDDQRHSLLTIKNHLSDNGRLVLNIFDPRLDMCLPGVHDRSAQNSVVKNASGNEVEVQVAFHENDTLNQILTEIWRFTEKDSSGHILRVEEELLKMRWTYRWEMRYLFELTGFEVENEFSDFKKSPPAYGKGQIWVVKKA